MKKCKVTIKTTFAVILSLLCLNLSSVRADDSDIFGANIVPNVLILFDDSSSMRTNNVTNTSLYDDNRNYAGSFSENEVYKLMDGQYSLYMENISQMPSGNAKTALGIAGSWTGTIGGSNITLQTGNYINYLACTDCNETISRLALPALL